jgi:putative transposase
MQLLEGQFAVYYNRRMSRGSAFWGERFHCTMIESGEHLWNCMKYIDLNLVRAGVVGHPAQWPWCGYHELVGDRQRYRLLDLRRVFELFPGPDPASFAQTYDASIARTIADHQLSRNSIWTQSIAVGSKSFVQTIAHAIRVRKRLRIAVSPDGNWIVAEEVESYGLDQGH